MPTLPGAKVPDAWAPAGLLPGYSLRVVGQDGFLCWGGEDVVAEFRRADYAKHGRTWYLKFRADVLAAMERHAGGREGRGRGG